MTSIVHLNALRDNYIWLIIGKNNHCVVVDPTCAEPVLERLNQLNLTLSAILLTHHHHDHIGGVNTLCEQNRELTVYGHASLHNKLNSAHFAAITEGDTISVDEAELTFEILSVPGHTLDHLAYLSGGHCFCGDTLFSAGCGRLFEGSAEQLYDSLQKIAALNPDTLLYPAHEYTQGNLIFAQHVDPENRAITERLKAVSKLRQQGVPSLPVPLSTELATNPFLRCYTKEIKHAVEQRSMEECPTTQQVFSRLRAWKDQF